MSWFNHIEKLNIHFQSISIRDNCGREIEANAGFSLWVDYTLGVRNKRKTIFLIGNGASASMASHVAADLAKNARIRTEVFSDLSLITAIANDISFEEVFAEPLRRRMTLGDMLVAISSSGQSPNILRAVHEAKALAGLVVTLSAMSFDNPLRKLGTLNFYLPADTYSLAETCHTAILHHWIDQVI